MFFFPFKTRHLSITATLNVLSPAQPHVKSSIPLGKNRLPIFGQFYLFIFLFSCSRLKTQSKTNFLKFKFTAIGIFLHGYNIFCNYFSAKLPTPEEENELTQFIDPRNLFCNSVYMFSR